MTREIHCGAVEGVSLAAIVDEHGPTDMLAEPSAPPCRIGDIVLAEVDRVDRSVGVLFLDVGLARPAVLPLRGEPMTEGPLLVQLVGLPREDKGAEATCDIAHAGRLLVHRPMGSGVAVSKGLAKAAVAWLGQPPAGGWIIRRAAAGQPTARIAAEAVALQARWQVLSAKVETATAPAVLETGPGVAERLILDTPDLGAIRVGDAARRRSLAGWLDATAPEIAGLLAGEPIDLAEEMVPLLEPVVPLPGGGSLAIEMTRALTAIDVDAGAAADALSINRAAAREIARQLRLRNIGGIVVIDFISMARRAEREALMDTVRESVAGDPAALTLGRGVSPLGLVELARQRRGRSLAEAFAGR